MIQVETAQKTFGKATRTMVKELIPNAKTFKKSYDGGILIKDSNGETVATWSPRRMKNGLIVIWEK